MTAPRRRTQKIQAISPVAPPAPLRLPPLTSERLRLRWMESHDLDALFAVYSDPEVTRFGTMPPFEHRDDASIYLESIQRGFENDRMLQWGVALIGTDRVIGTCTLAHVDHAQARAEVAFVLAQDYWRQRYATEALTSLLGHAFRDMGLRRLEADVHPRNQAGLRTLEALGFKREGYLRQRWLVAGERQDSVLLGLLDSDWARQH